MGDVGWTVLRDLGCRVQRSPEVTSVGIADGSRVDVLGVCHVPVKLLARIKIIPILVCPNLRCGLILGQDFWKLMGVVPDLLRDSWHFSSSPEVMSLASSALDKSLVTVDFLSAEQRSQLEKLIEIEFSSQPEGLGCTSVVKHRIEVNSAPIRQRGYPLSPRMQRVMDEELEGMLKNGIIERSSSPWSSPAVLIPKKDGSYRFCVDFRRLNAVTRRDAYPIPNISAILDRLREAKYLSSLDVKSAYWQVAMDDESKEFTAFAIPGRGLYQWRRMPFGLTNAPATWQRLIDRVIGVDLEPNVFVYLDDIIIISSTFESHLEILSKVLKRLRDAGLSVSKDKCHFCRQSLSYLGYVVDAQGLRVDPSKVDYIVNIAPPRNVKELRRFIGLA